MNQTILLKLEELEMEEATWGGGEIVGYRLHVVFMHQYKSSFLKNIFLQPIQATTPKYFLLHQNNSGVYFLVQHDDIIALSGTTKVRGWKIGIENYEKITDKAKLSKYLL